jgi:hypothetical protein
MPDLAPLFSAILATHVALAVSLFVPSLLLPFTLRLRPAAPDREDHADREDRQVREAPRPSPFVRLLLSIQAHGTVVIGAGLALTGAAMLTVLGPRMLEQPWLLVSLATYAIAASIAFVVQRPGLRRLLGRDLLQSDAERAAWRERARRQRYIAYALTSAVGFIAFMMSTKPELW